MQTLSSFPFADTVAQYLTDSHGRVGLTLFPKFKANQLASRRQTLRGEPFIDALPDPNPPPAIAVDPLVHLKIVGDPYPGAFAQGRTMRSAPSNDRFKFANQQRIEKDGVTTILTELRSPEAVTLQHRLTWHENESAAQINTTISNASPKPVTLEMLTTFSLGGITPFDPADAPNRLRVHRFRSVWRPKGGSIRKRSNSSTSNEAGAAPASSANASDRSAPCPSAAGFPSSPSKTSPPASSGAQLSWAGSWQLEISRQNDDLSISGGIADREYGHWTKTLSPGESFTTPPATVACVAGTLDDLCDRLTAAQARHLKSQPAVEHDLPIVFNEWCTTWGDPSHQRLVAIADRLAGSPIKYLVIDAGWYKTEGSDWSTGHGDWIPSPKLFPEGLATTAAAIRQRGLIPGLWFEMETVGDCSAAFSLVDMLLHRDGIPITVRNRRFWNLQNPAAVDYLSQHVIALLRDCNFGYLKVDYNETIGFGCDGAESPGEALRRQIDAVYKFFERIRAELPDLVIENCSSGGHRLEPGMMVRTAMSSFSDAHELPEIPLIAANLHRLMLPRQSQIWAVLHAADSPRRLDFSLAAAFLGRMCLSGEIDRLTPAQWQRVQEAMNIYRRAATIIRDGISHRFGEIGQSWRHPTGWQAIRRISAANQSALVVMHTFASPPSSPLHVPLPAANWRMAENFGTDGTISLDHETLTWNSPQPFSARILLLMKES